MKSTRNIKAFSRRVYNPETKEYDIMEACDPYIYESFLNTFFKAYNSNQQIMMVRFDLLFPKDSQLPLQQSTISKFTRVLKQKVRRRDTLGTKPVICETFWVKEWSQFSKDHPHYHVILFISTNIIQNKEDVAFNLIIPSWESVLGQDYKTGLVNRCESLPDNYLIFSKASLDALITHPCLNQSEELQQKYHELNMLFEHAKYLSKYRSKFHIKEKDSSKSKNYSGTRGYRYSQEDLEKFPMANPNIEKE